MTAPLSKADRLAIGGTVAPVVRRQAEKPRVVTVVGKDGQPVRQTTHVEVAKSVLARAEIEFSVQPGKRPEFIVCEVCGRPVKVPQKGRVPVRCRLRCEGFSPEERAAFQAQVSRFAAEKGLSEEWIKMVCAAKFGKAG